MLNVNHLLRRGVCWLSVRGSGGNNGSASVPQMKVVLLPMTEARYDAIDSRRKGTIPEMYVALSGSSWILEPHMAAYAHVRFLVVLGRFFAKKPTMGRYKLRSKKIFWEFVLQNRAF